jgi:phage-related protein
MGSHPQRLTLYIGSSQKDLTSLSHGVQEVFFYGINLAVQGKKAPDAKPLKGFGGANVFEIVERDRHGTYRAVYTVRYKEAVYVLHVFQKKSKQGIATPKQDIDLIRSRLKIAEADYRTRFANKEKK